MDSVKPEKDLDNKSEPKVEKEDLGHEVKDQVLHKLDQAAKERRDLEEKVIEPAKDLVQHEVEKLEKKKDAISDIQKGLHDKKEKLDELREKVVDEPVKEINKQYVERLKENASPENVMNKLGYNLNSQVVEHCSPESVKELMGGKLNAKPVTNSAIDYHGLKKKVSMDLNDKFNIGDKIEIARRETSDPLDHFT